MKPEPITITFAGRDFPIRPLTLFQVQRIEAAELRRATAMLPFRKDDGALDIGALIANGEIALEHRLEVIRIALGRDHREIAAALDDLEALAGEAEAAYKAILELGGFKLVDTLGEAEAAEIEAHFGVGSTAAASASDSAPETSTS
jgi:hypothetical protein